LIAPSALDAPYAGSSMVTLTGATFIYILPHSLAE
jgi:hypothetical protein